MIGNEEILLRLFAAALLGGLVGFERERKDWAVGIRTHMIASVAAALVMMVSSFGFADILGMPNVSLDPSRVASSVIIGIGYLCAGLILVSRPGNIKGITTASGLWATAAIGLAADGGMYFAAGATTVIALIILYGIQKLQGFYNGTKNKVSVSARLSSQQAADSVFSLFGAQQCSQITLRRKNKGFVVSALMIQLPESQFGTFDTNTYI